MGHGMTRPVSFVGDVDEVAVPPDCLLKKGEIKLGAEPCLVSIADQEFFIWEYFGPWFDCDYDFVFGCFKHAVLELFIQRVVHVSSVAKDLSLMRVPGITNNVFDLDGIV